MSNTLIKPHGMPSPEMQLNFTVELHEYTDFTAGQVADVLERTRGANPGWLAGMVVTADGPTRDQAAAFFTKPEEGVIKRSIGYFDETGNYQPIGHMSVRPVDESKFPDGELPEELKADDTEINYWIGEEYGNKGLGAQTISKIPELVSQARQKDQSAFGGRVLALVRTKNDYSQRAFNKLGYEAEGSADNKVTIERDNDHWYLYLLAPARGNTAAAA